MMAEGRRVTVALWVVQGLLALVFLFSGASKLVMSIEEMTKEVALPGAFLRFIGVAEVAGGLGLVLPGLLGIRPALTPLAAACLVIIMIGATTITAATMGGGASRSLRRLRTLEAGAARRGVLPAGPLGRSFRRHRLPSTSRRRNPHGPFSERAEPSCCSISAGVMRVPGRLRAAALRSITLH
jgi:uncharacterized membrane protein YphA (DoxX/SURF4 family)